MVIEALAKNRTALTTTYVDSCDKVTDVGIEALAKICTSLMTIQFWRLYVHGCESILLGVRWQAFTCS